MFVWERMWKSFFSLKPAFHTSVDYANSFSSDEVALQYFFSYCGLNVLIRLSRLTEMSYCIFSSACWYSFFPPRMWRGSRLQLLQGIMLQLYRVCSLVRPTLPHNGLGQFGVQEKNCDISKTFFDAINVNFRKPYF